MASYEQSFPAPASTIVDSDSETSSVQSDETTELVHIPPDNNNPVYDYTLTTRDKIIRVALRIMIFIYACALVGIWYYLLLV